VAISITSTRKGDRSNTNTAELERIKDEISTAMANSDLKIRTKDYALSVIRLFAELPKRTETQILGRQLLRSGTSVGAQYREATRAKSNLDFISKIEGSLQELEESEYWLELLGESGFCQQDNLTGIKKETGELKGIFVSIVRNTKAKSRPPKP
jgi:four helix bundle protein